MGGGGPPRTLPPTGGPNGPTGPGMPNLYEMAALTTEMDTQAVTTKVKEVLLANNVGQKVIEKLFSIFILKKNCERNISYCFSTHLEMFTIYVEPVFFFKNIQFIKIYM